MDIFQRTIDATKLADMLINLTIPMDLMNKFDQIVSKNAEFTVQLMAIRFLSAVLGRIEQALHIFQRPSIICDRISAIENYQQAILRVS